MVIHSALHNQTIFFHLYIVYCELWHKIMKAINWPFLAFFIETSSQLMQCRKSRWDILNFKIQISCAMCILRVLGRICCIFSIIKIEIIVFYNEKKLICCLFHLVIRENNENKTKWNFHVMILVLIENKIWI